MQGIVIDIDVYRSLNKVPIEKERGGRTLWRSGVYTLAALADCSFEEPGADPLKKTHRRLVLFQTNIGHAGEWLDELLCERTLGLSPPILMSDALSSNHATAIDYQKSLCNVHFRRGFAELMEQVPEAATFALACVEPVWANETHCKDKRLSDDERLVYHQTHSRPHMNRLKAWSGQELSDTGSVEPNSNLGKTMAYMVSHFDGLSAFCRIAGAPVDNKEIERLIKLIVRARKNSLFFNGIEGGFEPDEDTTSESILVNASVEQAGGELTDLNLDAERVGDSVSAREEAQFIELVPKAISDETEFETTDESESDEIPRIEIGISSYDVHALYPLVS